MSNAGRLVAFLHARWAEDEAIARAIDDKQEDSGWSASFNAFGLANTPPGWYITPHIGLAYEAESAAHIARFDPSRVLHEIAAKRALITDMEHLENVAEAEAEVDRVEEAVAFEARARGIRVALIRLAGVYSEHPDYAEAISDE